MYMTCSVSEYNSSHAYASYEEFELVAMYVAIRIINYDNINL